MDYFVKAFSNKYFGFAPPKVQHRVHQNTHKGDATNNGEGYKVNVK